MKTLNSYFNHLATSRPLADFTAKKAILLQKGQVTHLSEMYTLFITCFTSDLTQLTQDLSFFVLSGYIWFISITERPFALLVAFMLCYNPILQSD